MIIPTTPPPAITDTTYYDTAVNDWAATQQPAVNLNTAGGRAALSAVRILDANYTAFISSTAMNVVTTLMDCLDDQTKLRIEVDLAPGWDLQPGMAAVTVFKLLAGYHNVNNHSLKAASLATLTIKAQRCTTISHFEELIMAIKECPTPPADQLLYTIYNFSVTNIHDNMWGGEQRHRTQRWIDALNESEQNNTAFPVQDFLSGLRDIERDVLISDMRKRN